MAGVISLTPNAIAQPLQWYSNASVKLNFEANGTPLFLLFAAVLLFAAFIYARAKRD
jgi:hypothetical protein